MSNRLEQFVKDNREDFDKYEPGPVVWHNIQQELKRQPERKGILISMKTLRWSAAAAVAILLGTGAWLFIEKNNQQEHVTITTVAKNNTPAKTTTDPLPAKESNQLPEVNNNSNQEALAANDEYNQEMYHYTKLVEMKQDEIKRITKDEPLLYQQFAGDFNKLDSTFHILKQQLPENPNREQILEAMMRNLQLQMELLNQQLNIIKKINHVKQTEYEKAYKSI